MLVSNSDVLRQVGDSFQLFLSSDVVVSFVAVALGLAFTASAVRRVLGAFYRDAYGVPDAMPRSVAPAPAPTPEYFKVQPAGAETVRLGPLPDDATRSLNGS